VRPYCLSVNVSNLRRFPSFPSLLSTDHYLSSERESPITNVNGRTIVIFLCSKSSNWQENLFQLRTDWHDGGVVELEDLMWLEKWRGKRGKTKDKMRITMPSFPYFFEFEILLTSQVSLLLISRRNIDSLSERRRPCLHVTFSLSIVFGPHSLTTLSPCTPPIYARNPPVGEN